MKNLSILWKTNENEKFEKYDKKIMKIQISLCQYLNLI